MGTRHHGALLAPFGEKYNTPSKILDLLEQRAILAKHHNCRSESSEYPGWNLACDAQTNALSSHISSLRALLEIEQRKPVEARITQAKGVICERRTVNGKPRFFYRLEY